MPYKISLIIPIYNSEETLKNTLNSVINQTMNLNDIQVIMVNDGSTDKSKIIMEEYASKCSNFLAINNANGGGGAWKPRNIGLKHVAAEYIMFLDSDDEYKPEAFEKLYNKIQSEKVDLVIGRIVVDLPDIGYVRKSYSPFEDNLNFENEIKTTESSKLKNFIWKAFLFRFVFGKIKKSKSSEIFTNIFKNPSILTMSGSLMPKIFKRQIIEDKDIKFKDFITGEDFNFLMEYFINSSGNVLLLNNDIIYKQINRLNYDENKSVSNNINFKLVSDELNATTHCLNTLKKINYKYNNIIFNMHISTWFILYYLKFNSSLKEEIILFNSFKKFKKLYNTDLKGKIIVYFIFLYMKLRIIKKKLV
ncbi:MAG: glycosyltransferase family 2 protein [Methanobrevibacter sp.]|jgi:glycosyltransferase involved in cell wall biosynthesis|nr:glycosyltransferase family 2 protein [Methanobrevibacter sp.]